MYNWNFIEYIEYDLFKVNGINVSVQRGSRRETLASKRLPLARSRVLR